MQWPEPDAKAAARDGLARWLRSAEARDIIVRVNTATTTWHDDDMNTLAAAPRVIGLMLPKAVGGDLRDAQENARGHGADRSRRDGTGLCRPSRRGARAA